MTYTNKTLQQDPKKRTQSIEYISEKFLLRETSVGTLHLSRSHGDRLGAPELAAVFLLWILFSDSFSESQNLNTVLLDMLFPQQFLGLPLLPPCNVPCRIVSPSPADLDTRLNHTDVSLRGSLRSRRLKGKEKGILGARETRGAHSEGGRETPARRPLFPPSRLLIMNFLFAAVLKTANYCFQGSSLLKAVTETKRVGIYWSDHSKRTSLPEFRWSMLFSFCVIWIDCRWSLMYS